jgi:hypothetical protein
MADHHAKPNHANSLAPREAVKKSNHHTDQQHNPPAGDVIRAYHEAGHALVCYLMNRHFNTLSICDGEHSHDLIPSKKWEAFTPEKCADLAIRDRVERNILALFAGDMAQEILTGKSVARRESSNYHHISELGACVMDTGEVLNAYLHYMALRTRHLIMLPQNWDAIQILADALIKRRRLDYAAACRILDQAMNIGLKDLMHHSIHPAGNNPNHRFSNA